jgi:hypothetical protein
MSRQSPRYRVIANSDNRATLIEYDRAHYDPPHETRTYFRAPAKGGYVWDADRDTQICRELSTCGATLCWTGHGTLADLIRREARIKYAAIDRDERRESRY